MKFKIMEILLSIYWSKLFIFLQYDALLNIYASFMECSDTHEIFSFRQALNKDLN